MNELPEYNRAKNEQALSGQVDPLVMCVFIDDDVELRCGGYERVGWRDQDNRQSPWATCPGCQDCTTEDQDNRKTHEFCSDDA